MIPITPAQLKALHVALRQKGMEGQKANLVLGISQGRTESSRELSMEEARELIKYLTPQPPNPPEGGLPSKQAEGVRKMRGKMKQQGLEIGWNTEALNDWCIRYGYLKKGFYLYTYVELPKLLSQFEFGPYKHYLSK